MILVTGFGPYNREAINASACVVEALQQELPEPLRPLRGRLAFEVIACADGPVELESQRLLEQLDELLEQYRPSLCLFTGQAPRESMVRIERVGLNFFMDRRIEPQGPVGYWSNLPDLEQLPAVLKEARIPAAHSNYAGAHLCNHILYSSLHRAALRVEPFKAGFVHIPVTPAQTLDVHRGSPHMATSMGVDAVTRIIVHLASA